MLIQHGTRDQLGARYGATVGYKSFSSEAYFVLKNDANGGISLDVEKLNYALTQISSKNLAPVIFGFTYVIYDTLRGLNKALLTASFDEGTVLHIGGWKKLEAQKMSNPPLIALCHVWLHENCVIDAYGFTEQMGINHLSIASDEKICPSFARVLVRDPITLEVLPHGHEGLLQFISPLPVSYPGISVLTDDLGIVTSEFGQINGLYGTLFRVTGRAKNAEIRGCGDVMSAYLERTDDVAPTKFRAKLDARLLYLEKNFVHLNHKENSIYLEGLPAITDLAPIGVRIRENLRKIEKYSVDDLIAFFSIVSKQWLEKSGPISALQKHGLSFLVSWLEAENLRAITNKSMKGDRQALDRFVVDTDFPVRSLRALPRGIVGHWLAGNVPLLGMLGLVQSIITRNANILRVPASNSSVMPIILGEIAKAKVTLPSGKVVDGSDISDTVAVIYYDKNDQDFANAFSLMCDARIAWGGAEAIQAISKLPTKIETETIIFGPKLSYSAIGAEMFSAEKNIEKLFRRLATDCSVFDQYACASPHTVFVERSSDITEEEFCERFATHMDKAAYRIPKDDVDAGTAANIIAKRFEYDFTGKVWQSSGTTWTIVKESEEFKLANPVYSRFITVIFVDDIMEAASLANDDIQTIALAMSLERKINFAEVAAAKGAIRFPEIGRMTHFEAPWDGIFLMDRLVRFVSLGGPVV